MLGYMSNTVQTVGFYEKNTTCNCLNTELITQTLPSITASTNLGTASTSTINPSFSDTYS